MDYLASLRSRSPNETIQNGVTVLKRLPERMQLAYRNWPEVLGTLAVVFVVWRAVEIISGLKQTSYLPGIRAPFASLQLPGAALPYTWWNPGLDFPWWRRFELYQSYASETISYIPLLYGRPSLYTSNLEVAKQVVAGGVKSAWIKPENASMALLLWGMNLAAAEKETWRRHRRVMGPAFNTKTYHLVWDETVNTYRDMVAKEGWLDKSSTEVEKIQKFTFKFALLVLAKCGFGIHFDWDAPPTGPDGSMSVQQALNIVTETNMFHLSMPKWVLRLPFEWIRSIRTAHRTIDSFMHAQVADRKAEIRELLSAGEGERVRRDVFSTLVRANEEDGGKYPLNDVELIGNVFVILFAGHETSAHTLAATLGLLSIHPELQDEVLKQIMDVVGPDRDPGFSDYEALDKVLAAFYEALRLFPAGSIMIREPIEDTTLELPGPNGPEDSKFIFTPKGLRVVVDMIGVQYNPRYFPDPAAYRPSRWHANADQPSGRDPEGFTAFSFGPRTCIGRKFATAEAVCFLTLLLRDFRVEPVLALGETTEQWRERVLQGKMVLTLSVLPVPVRFVRRRP